MHNTDIMDYTMEDTMDDMFENQLGFEATCASQVIEPCYTISSETININEITDSDSESDGEAESLSANAGPSF